jgi:hypothetical protein
MRFQNGTMSFPNMTLNSSLGYIQLSGSQGLDLTMDYFIRVPLKLVKSAVFSKLFGRKPKDINPEQEDEIIVKDPNRKTRFINIRLTGTPEDYKISLRKNPELKKGVEFQKDENFLFPPIENEVVE